MAEIRGDTPVSRTKIDPQYGPALENIIDEALFGRGSLEVEFSVRKGGTSVTRAVIAGHVWGRVLPDMIATPGPEPSDVMVIGKMLGLEEFNQKRHFVGPSSQYLISLLDRLGCTAEERGSWYVTNLLKTTSLDLSQSILPAWWIKNQIHLLYQEIFLVRLRFLLLVGADATKAILGRSTRL